MADISSRSFKHGEAFSSSAPLTHLFNKKISLPQKCSWREFQIPSEIYWRVMSCIRGEPSKMGQLLRLKGIDKNIGATGASTQNSGSAAPFWTMRPNWNESSYSQPLLSGSGQAFTAEETKSRFRPLLNRSRPSPRPSNWLEKLARSTKPPKLTSSQLAASLKVCDERIHSQDPN